MPVTPEHQIYYPSGSDPIAPLESQFATLASSVDSALDATTYDLSNDIQDLADQVAGLPTPPRMWTGTVNLTESFQTFDYPPGIFTSTANVFLQVLSASGGSIGAVAMVSERSASGFRARKVNGTNASIAFMYFAIQVD